MFRAHGDFDDVCQIANARRSFGHRLRPRTSRLQSKSATDVVAPAPYVTRGMLDAKNHLFRGSNVSKLFHFFKVRIRLWYHGGIRVPERELRNAIISPPIHHRTRTYNFRELSIRSRVRGTERQRRIRPPIHGVDGADTRARRPLCRTRAKKARHRRIVHIDRNRQRTLCATQPVRISQNVRHDGRIRRFRR